MDPPHATIDGYQRRCGAVILSGVILFLAALAGRLVYINTTMRPRLAAKARQQQWSTTQIPARRGMILDARGRILSLSRQVPDVFVDPALIEDVDALAAELGARLNLAPGEIAERIQRRSGSRFVVIAPGVDGVTAEAVRALGHPGVGLVHRSVRTYPLGPLTAHVLGFVGRDEHGLEGIELAYDEQLSGTAGSRSTVRDGRRRALWRSTGDLAPAFDGANLVLTIDSEIQRIATEALAGTVDQFQAQSGVSIVVSPKDGSILAMTCYPSFDPDNAAAVSAEVRRNRAVTDPVEPGSAFKPIIACGALDGGFVTTSEHIDCHRGSYRFGRRLVRDTSPHGMMDLTGIIAKSSNIGMGLIAQRVGNPMLHATIRRFGFGERSGVGFPGESSGIVHPLERWTGYSNTSVAFGYEVGVTPLQLVDAFCAIVNGGILLKPRLVQAVQGPDGQVIESFEHPEVVRRVVSSRVAQYMRDEALVAVVEHGGGRRANGGPYRILGKTGTAKLLYEDGRGYEPGAYLGTFVGAAPVRDPELVVLVMVRRPNPEVGYYGGVVSAPAVRKILEEALAYLNVPPDAPGTRWATRFGVPNRGL